MNQRNLLAVMGFALALGLSPASAQYVNPVTPLDGGAPVGASNPLHVAGTFSASLSGFTPGLTFANLTATGSSASVALPAGTVVFFQNNGTTTVSCTLGVGSATATANEILIPASSGVPLVVGSNTFGACIDQSGTASNLVVLAGGSGLGTPFGGGGGGGSGGAVTLASGAVASGAYSSGAFASGAVSSGAYASGSLASGAVVDITNLSTPITPNTATATKGALLGMQYNSTQATFTNGQQGAVQGSSRGAMYVAVGADGFNVTNAGTFATQVNGFTSWAGGTLGAMANYGTSPGAVLVPGVNAFITNTPAVSQSGTWNVNATLQATATTAIGKVDPNTIATWGLMAGTTPGTAPTNTQVIGGIYNSSAPTPTTGQTLPLQLDSSGNLNVNIKAGAGSGGTAIADQGTFTQGTTNETPMGCLYASSYSAGTSGKSTVVSCTSAGSVHTTVDNTNANGQATMANSSPVVIASNQSAVPTSGAVNVGPTDCSGSVTTGGTAQNALTAQTTLHGLTIMNIDTTEPLWISFTTTAAASTAGSFPLQAATATTFASPGSFTTPNGFGTNHALSVIAATTGHKWSCTWW
jgi:hypothetical protein